MAIGLRQLLPLIPPLLISGWSITSPTTALADCRIMDSSDPTYGTIKWVPRADDHPFAVLWSDERKYDYQQTNARIIKAQIKLFLAIGHAEAPVSVLSFNDLANAWLDTLEPLIDTNRRLGAGIVPFLSQGISQVRWELLGPAKLIEKQEINGVPFYGAQIMTELDYLRSATYAG